MATDDGNIFLRNIQSQYEDQFGRDGAAIGTVFRIRLPNDYLITGGSENSLQMMSELAPEIPDLKLSGKEVAVIGTAAVLAKNPSISRRFWARS